MEEFKLDIGTNIPELTYLPEENRPAFVIVHQDQKVHDMRVYDRRVSGKLATHTVGDFAAYIKAFGVEPRVFVEGLTAKAFLDFHSEPVEGTEVYGHCKHHAVLTFEKDQTYKKLKANNKTWMRHRDFVQIWEDCIDAIPENQAGFLDQLRSIEAKGSNRSNSVVKEGGGSAQEDQAMIDFNVMKTFEIALKPAARMDFKYKTDVRVLAKMEEKNGRQTLMLHYEILRVEEMDRLAEDYLLTAIKAGLPEMDKQNRILRGSFSV